MEFEHHYGSPIEDLDLSYSTTQGLKHKGIKTVEELRELAKDPDELIRIRGMGYKDYKRILEAFRHD